MDTWAAQLEPGTYGLAAGVLVVHNAVEEAIEAAETHTGASLVAMASEEGPRAVSAEAAPRSLAEGAVISAKPC